MQHRRLNERFANCTTWTEFYGDTTTIQSLQVAGYVEENTLYFPDGAVNAVALRSYDAASETWAIWWLDGRAPHTLDVPVVGTFAGDVSTFWSADNIAGVPTLVKFTWYINPGAKPRWEQAFSQDNGVSWETNWVMDFPHLNAT